MILISLLNFIFYGVIVALFSVALGGMSGTATERWFDSWMLVISTIVLLFNILLFLRIKKTTVIAMVIRVLFLTISIACVVLLLASMWSHCGMTFSECFDLL